MRACVGSTSGCIAYAKFNLDGMKGIVALFPSSFLARLTLSVPHLSPLFQQVFQTPCVTPVGLSVHEKSNPSLSHEGSFNNHGQCSKEKVGGRHDPGLACGPDGAELCEALSIPPFE